MFSGKDFYESKFLHLLIPRETLMSGTNVWTWFSWLAPQQLSYLLIFGPYIFNFLLKFASPSCSMTRISPGQHPDNAETSCLIILWTFTSHCKYTPSSLGYFPFEILYGRTPPVIGKLKGNPQQLADLEMSWHLQALGKVFHNITWENLRKDTHSFGQLGSSLSARRWGMG